MRRMAPIAALEKRERELKQEIKRAGQVVQQYVREKKDITQTQRQVTKMIDELVKVQRHLESARTQKLPSDYVTDPRSMRFKYQVTNHLLWQVPVYERDIPEVKPYRLQAPNSDLNSDKSFYPSAGDIQGIHAADFAEFAYLHEKAWTTRHARKLFANIPSFMIFDDHEITDDWNFNANWVNIIHTKKDDYGYWPKTIIDGLVAYWMYQGWGNISPLDWEQDSRVQILLEARRTGRDALPELRNLIKQYAVRPPGRLQWHYQLPIASPKFLITDTRTRKVLHTSDDTKSSALDPKQLEWLKTNLGSEANGAAAFVVMGLPFILPRFISWGMTHADWLAAIKSVGVEEALRGAVAGDLEHPARDATWTAVKTILGGLQSSVTRLKVLGILSGDVHMSFNLAGQIREDGYEAPPELLQMVCSGFRNAPSDDRRKWINRFLDWFKRRHTFRDLIIRPAGFESHKDDSTIHRNTILSQTSIALVDVDISKEGKANIHQRYLTRAPGKAALEAHDVWYRTSEINSERYLTPLWADQANGEREYMHSQAPAHYDL